jgi:hypothetical protein
MERGVDQDGHTPASSGQEVEAAALRSGDRILVGGREAVFVYRAQAGAVVRYQGELQTRVVPLRKLRQAGQTPT